MLVNLQFNLIIIQPMYYKLLLSFQIDKLPLNPFYVLIHQSPNSFLFQIIIVSLLIYHFHLTISFKFLQHYFSGLRDFHIPSIYYCTYQMFFKFHTSGVQFKFPVVLIFLYSNSQCPWLITLSLRSLAI